MTILCSSLDSVDFLCHSISLKPFHSEDHQPLNGYLWACTWNTRILSVKEKDLPAHPMTF